MDFKSLGGAILAGALGLASCAGAASIDQQKSAPTTGGTGSASLFEIDRTVVSVGALKAVEAPSK